MVISNLNIKLLEDRLGFIIRAKEKLKQLSQLSEEIFLKNDTPAIAESYLRRALEAIFDIGRHITAKTADKGIVEYKELAKTLGGKKIITADLSAKLSLMAGYRNRLVHFYHEVDDHELYVILKNNLIDIENFIKEIKNFIQEYKKANSSQ